MSTKGDSRKKKKLLRRSKAAERVANDLSAIRALAPQIQSNNHLRDIIKGAKPELREGVYKVLAPHIKKFAVYSFEELMNEQRIVVIRHV